MNENDFSQALNKIGAEIDHALAEIEQERETFWNSLSKDDQLKAFCAVVSRIFTGEIKEKRSYRGILYDVFGFGPEAYVQAQMAGYLAIHNSLFEENNEELILEAFCKLNHIENYEEKIKNYML